MYFKQELKTISSISLPLLLGTLGNMVIGFTDHVMLGRLGSEALAATGLSLSVFTLIGTIGWGLTFPVIIFASQACGKGRLREVPRIIRQGLWVAGLFSTAAGFILWRLEDILLLTGQNPELAKMAGHYMNYYLWTMFPIMASLTFVRAYTALGRTRTVALVLWMEVLLNLGLNYGLIFGKWGLPEMGMAGAGLSSVLAYGAGFLVFFLNLGFHKTFRSSLSFRNAWRPNPVLLKKMIRLGWPKSVEMLMKNGLYAAITLLAGWFSVKAIAAHSIAFNLYLMANLAAFSVANGVTVRIGMVNESQRPNALLQTLTAGIFVLFLFLSPLLTVFWGFPQWAIMLYSGREYDLELLEFASPLIVLMGLFLVADGLRTVISHGLSGLADMKVPALMTTLAYWGLVFPLAVWFAFSLEWGVRGLWLGLITGMCLTALAFSLRFRQVAHPSYRFSTKTMTPNQI